MINSGSLKVSLAFACAGLLLLAGFPLRGQSAESARKALDLLLNGRYAEFSALLSPEAKDTLTADFLRDRVGTELKSFGTFEDVGEPATAKMGESDVVSFPVRFSKTKLNVQFSLNASHQISGLHFRSPDDPLPQVWSRPSYSKPDAFHEREVTVGDDRWKLGGTFTVPNGPGPFPAVVLVHGPGPNDRDESIYATRMFADLAEGLASRGIAVLRYDKRTRVYGQEMAGTAFTLRDETVDDALRALALIRRQPETDGARTFVLGHSLGGYAVPMIAREDGRLAGAVVLAGNARHIEDVSLAQTEFLLKAKGGATPEEEKKLDQMKADVTRIRSLTKDQDNPPTLLGLPAIYFLNLKGYDPVAEADRLTIPMLFLQGGRDFQVTMQDFGLWKSGLGDKKNAAFQTFPSLNHLFISGDGPPSPLEYRRAGNVSADVIETVAGWIAGARH